MGMFKETRAGGRGVTARGLTEAISHSRCRIIVVILLIEQSFDPTLIRAEEACAPEDLYIPCRDIKRRVYTEGRGGIDNLYPET